MRHGPFLSALLAAIAGALTLAASPEPAEAADALLEPWAGTGEAPPPWHVVGLPQQKKPLTRFSVVDHDGHRAVRIETEASYGNLVHPLPSIEGAAKLSWRWRIERPLEASDLREKRGDDSEVRVCVFFDEPLKDIPFVERQVLAFARSRSSEPLPNAMLCYVHSTSVPAGSVLPSPFTRRVRYLVLETEPEKMSRWVSESRDVGADFRRAFGDETRGVPPIVGVAIGGDADNTKGSSVAYVAGLKLER